MKRKKLKKHHEIYLPKETMLKGLIAIVPTDYGWFKHYVKK